MADLELVTAHKTRARTFRVQGRGCLPGAMVGPSAIVSHGRRKLSTMQRYDPNTCMTHQHCMCRALAAMDVNEMCLASGCCPGNMRGCIAMADSKGGVP